MRSAIVITSIFPPTEAVHAFSHMKEVKLIVVGDRKTPTNWFCDNVDYISFDRQKKSDSALSKILPSNHYCRKMLGYLEAIDLGVEYIIDTDDDNIPKSNWGFPEFEQTYECINDDLGFVNIYQLFTRQNIWPRGLPLDIIKTDFELDERICLRKCNVGIWQGLADEDPDVDAIYRLTSDMPCYFNERAPIVLGYGTVCPFNTQNTIIREELFPLMYLPTSVTFRFTDILRGLVAQPIMWLYNYQLGFINSTVIQKRNPHDYMKDFASEIPMYQSCRKVIELVTTSISDSEGIETNLYAAYKSLAKSGIVCEKEIETLNAWLLDLERLR